MNLEEGFFLTSHKTHDVKRPNRNRETESRAWKMIQSCSSSTSRYGGGVFCMINKSNSLMDVISIKTAFYFFQLPTLHLCLGETVLKKEMEQRKQKCNVAIDHGGHQLSRPSSPDGKIIKRLHELLIEGRTTSV